MKKIFYLFLLMIFGINYGFAQISQFNNLCTNSTNLTFNSDYNTKEFKTSSASCAKDDSDIYKNINYYKVISSGTFEFQYRSNSLVNFHVWVLSESELNNFFNNNATRYNSVRSSYSSVLNNEKGLFASSTDDCEYYNNTSLQADGKLEPLNVTVGQYIVIGFVTRNQSAIIDYVHTGGSAIVCAPEPNTGNTVLNGKCYNESYTLSEIKNNVKSKIQSDYNQNVDVNNIKIFDSQNSTTEITTDINSNGGFNQTFVAKVFNGPQIEYIYNVSVNFKPQLTYNVNNVTENNCGTSFQFSKNDLIRKMSTISSDKFSDYEVYIDGVIVNGPINLQNSTTYKVKLKYIGTEFCSTDDPLDEVVLKLVNSNPILPLGKYKEVCNTEVLSEAQILEELGYSSTDYKLVNTPPTVYNFDTNSEFKFNVQIVNRNNSSCVSNIVEFTVKRKPNVGLNNLPDLVTCKSDFSFDDFKDKIDQIKNSDASILLTLTFNGIDYSEAELQNLYNTIINSSTGNQTNFNLLIKGNKEGQCESTTTFKITIKKSSFQTQSIEPLKSTCTEVGAGYVFTKADIENYIKSKLGNTITAIKGISDVTLTDNNFETIDFQVQVNRESCWSETMQLTLQNITKPNFSDKTITTEYCEGESLRIDDNLLTSTFGASILNYEIYVDGNRYTNGTPIQKVLTFSGENVYSLPIEIKSNGCSQIVQLKVVKKGDVSLSQDDRQDIKNSKIEFCSSDFTSAIAKIEILISKINSENSLQTTKSSADILAQFTQSSGNVTVEFFDPAKCGTVDIEISYQKNEKPQFQIVNPEPVCTDQKYLLDFEQLANEKGLNVVDYDYQVIGNGVVQTPTNEYQYYLIPGNYTVIINRKGVDVCAYETQISVTEAERPEIDKVSVTTKTIIVSAKGNPVLQYALFDENDNVIVQYQSSNELIIPDNIINSYNFTVRVKSNDCAISQPQFVAFLSLPNGFSPNGDGINDVWKPKGMGDKNNSYQLIIFDRYGKQIYYKEGVNIIEWNGTLNGKPLPDDTYWYSLKPIGQSSILQVQYSGSILVKRKIK